MNLPVTIALNDHSPDDPWYDLMWPDIAKMQSKGIKVIGMLGGAAPGTYDALTPENFDTYYPQLARYIRKYRIDGMDLDVEQPVEIDDIVRLIRRLKKDFGPNFIITLAPVASAMTNGGNLSGFSYEELEAIAGRQIDFYNCQFYSGFGSFFPDDQYIDIIEFGWNPSRIVATTLTNPDLGFGYIDPNQTVQSVTSLAARYGHKFGGVNGWEYFISMPNVTEPWQWATLMKHAMHNIKKRYEDLERAKRSRIWRSVERT